MVIFFITFQPLNTITPATTSSPISTYPISASSAVDPNYAILSVGGTLTVAPAGTFTTAATQAVTFSNTSATTYGQIARGGNPESLYLGFNLARKFF